ncbi:MAG: hypothetical protein JOZ19_10125 [Rubrobacter sp.]|nr:hypothetical protein [Rubrobacter sp.]
MIEDVKMNLAAIIVGILAALLALVLVGIATAAGALLSIVQGVAAPVRTTSKPMRRTAGVHPAKDAEVVKVPEERCEVEEFRSAA